MTIIQRYIEAHRKAQALREEVERLRAEWESEHSEKLDALRRANTELKVLDASLRAWAVEQYKQTGEKQVAPGVSVVLQRRVAYDDAEAIKWAVAAGLYDLLSLRSREFEKMARTGSLPFVEVEFVPGVRVSTETLLDSANQKDE